MEPWYSIHWFNWDVIRSYNWAYPYFLYALPGVPILFWLREVFHKNDKQRLVIPYDVREASKDWFISLRLVQPLATFFALIMLIVALARPQVVTERLDRYSEGVDIMLLLDISDSMTEKDVSPDRLTAAKRVAREFIRGRLQDRIGLIIFAGEAFSLCPLTTDYDLLYAFLDDVKPDMIGTAGTAIGSALAVAVNRMRDSNSQSKVAILISDGDNTSGNLDPVTAAGLAKLYRVKIYTVSVGKPKVKSTTADTLGIASVSTDENELRKLADIGSGKFFRAMDSKSLSAVFEQINNLEKVKYQDVKFREVKDHYRPYLYWGIVLLLVALWSKSTFMSNILED
jgi:Ca-activated chloride channel family protein